MLRCLPSQKGKVVPQMFHWTVVYQQLVHHHQFKSCKNSLVQRWLPYFLKEQVWKINFKTKRQNKKNKKHHVEQHHVRHPRLRPFLFEFFNFLEQKGCPRKREPLVIETKTFFLFEDLLCCAYMSRKDDTHKSHLMSIVQQNLSTSILAF